MVAVVVVSKLLAQRKRDAPSLLFWLLDGEDYRYSGFSCGVEKRRGGRLLCLASILPLLVTRLMVAWDLGEM